MKNVLFCLALKTDALHQFEAFAKEIMKRKEEYKEMLIRYDIYSTQIWHKKMNGSDYIYASHQVGALFNEKMRDAHVSTHPFDQWFNENMMALCDFTHAECMEGPRQLFDFTIK